MTDAESIPVTDDQTFVMADYEKTLLGISPPTEAETRVDDSWESPSQAEEILLGCLPFTTLSSHVRRAVAASLTPVELAPGALMIQQGVPGKGLWIIVSGLVEVHVHDDLDRTIFINAVGAGEVLGEMSLLTQQPATASVMARETTRAFLLPADAFHRLAGVYRSLCVVLTNVVAARLGGAEIDVLAGKVLDRYRIRGRLGRGGMSIVYDAERLEDGCRSALKMMSHRLVYDTMALDLFHQEADLIERFDHPHIVRLLGRFEAFHTHFIAMEFCDGQDLKSLLQRNGPFPLAQARRIVGQLASAVLYSHDAGVIHRDIKPSNVMLDRLDRVMLMDFGLAKPSADAILPAAAIGTPRYMAYEQLRGTGVSEATDWFALGCVAYELVRGRALIAAQNIAELRAVHEHWNVNKILQECEDLDDDFQKLLAGTLPKDSGDRRVDLHSIAHWATA